MNILSEDTISFKDKMKLLPIAPFMYFLFYLLSYVEYLALIKSLARIHNLSKSITMKQSTWKPVQRYEYTTASSSVPNPSEITKEAAIFQTAP